MGRSKVFIRSPKTVFELEELRRKRVEEIATLIQKTYRGSVKRRRVRRREGGRRESEEEGGMREGWRRE